MARGLSLEWKHCPDGIELIDLGPPKEHRGPRPQTMASDIRDPTGKTFRCRTSRRYPIRLSIDGLENPIVLRFANARDDDARASFLGRFGLLHADEAECGLEELKGYQVEMRKLLASAGVDEPDIALLNKRLRSSRSDLVPLLDGRRLSFRLDSLYGLMLREIVMVVEKDARFTTCQRCQAAFLTGPATGRRSHAVYCSDRCRVAAMRARNAG